jgi:hypothetical protein
MEGILPVDLAGRVQTEVTRLFKLIDVEVVWVERYDNVRLNSAIGCITPQDMLAGRRAEIHAQRDRKLEEARKQRQIRRQHAA